MRSGVGDTAGVGYVDSPLVVHALAREMRRAHEPRCHGSVFVIWVIRSASPIPEYPMRARWRAEADSRSFSMPELPEVEVVRRGLERRVLGRTVRAAHVREPRLRWPVPALAQPLAGAALREVARRGKYLLLDFGHGTLIAHLGMSGNFRFLAGESPEAPGPHDHVDLVFEHGTLRYRDPRRFGAMLWHDARDGPVLAHPLLASLGAEPLSVTFDGALLHRATRARSGAIKSVLLGGDVVVGVGNIYASESLFRAGIRPTTAARRIALPRYERLASAIRQTLNEAIERGGSTLRDFVSSDGAAGCYQSASLVYGRAGQPCRACGAPVRMLRQQQRSTFYCPRCQR